MCSSARFIDLLFYRYKINTRIRSPNMAWNLTLEQTKDSERIEKRAIRIIHLQYEHNQALVVSNLKTLKEGRDDLCVDLCASFFF